MAHSEISFIPLLIVIALAFLVPILLSRVRSVRIPVVVGEIIAGIIVSQSGLGLVKETADLQFLSELGFAFLMFLSGLEIDFSNVLGGEARKGDTGKVRRILSHPFVIGHILFGLTIIGSGLAALVLVGQGLVEDPWIMALILSTTSLGVVVPVLKERGLMSERYGQYIHGVENVIAWVHNPAWNGRFRKLGARLVNPAYSTLLMMVSMVLSPGVYSITPDVDETQEVRQIKLQNSDLVGKRLADLGLPGSILVLMIERGGDVLTPDRETLLRANDTITLVGMGSEVDEAVKLLARDGT
jgi:predicted Kef-type K+ transport protein